jgi:hypothetical protein
VSKYRLELLDDRGLWLSNAGIFDTIGAAESYAHGISLTCNWRICVEWTLKEKYADIYMTELMFGAGGVTSEDPLKSDSN